MGSITENNMIKIIGINWTWQSIDSISIKSPLGGRLPEIIPRTGANWAQKDIF